jgi:hypothetical protein
MENAGFSRVISSSNGLRYELPSATYSATTTNTTAEVLEIADSAAAATRRQRGVLVTEGSSAWKGLPTAR